MNKLSQSYYATKDTRGVLSFVSGAIERASIIMSGNSWKKEILNGLNDIKDKNTRGLIAQTITNVDKKGRVTLAPLTPARTKVLATIVARNDQKERNLEGKVLNLYRAYSIFAPNTK